MRQTAFLPMVQRAQYGFQAADWKRGFERYNDLIDALAAGDGEWAAASLRAHFHASKHLLRRAMASKIAAQRGSKSARPPAISLGLSVGARTVLSQRLRRRICTCG